MFTLKTLEACAVITLCLYGSVSSQVGGDGKDAADESGTEQRAGTSSGPTTTTEEIYRMDLIPTGTLPDNVYRELAWFGILQIQPIPASIKNRMVARLIWQHTLGRPHVLLELNQGYQSPGLENRKTISEKGVVWARSQESKKQIILEAIRRGGNGITIRTVTGTTQTTEFMITSGMTFACGENSKILRDLFQMPEKRTAIGTCSAKGGAVMNGVRVVDECVEAEFTNREYSFGEGWVFCMGHGERDKQRNDAGKIDCGAKQKVLYASFLEKCAIDQNVVIKYEYFGDMPRKELLQEQSICLVWSPCTLYYMYRLEPLPEPAGVATAADASVSCMPEGTPCVGCMFSASMGPQGSDTSTVDGAGAEQETSGGDENATDAEGNHTTATDTTATTAEITTVVSETTAADSAAPLSS